MNTQTADQSDNLQQNIANHRNWLRLLYMLLFALLLHVAGIVMWALCALQFIFALTTGQDNANLRQMGKAVSRFIHQALLFVSYNTERKPFPFAHWPEETWQEEPAEDIEGEIVRSDEREQDDKPNQ